MHLYPLRIACALAGICLLAGSAVAAPINIDTFDLGAAQASVFGTGSTLGGETIGDSAQTIGGARYYVVTGQGSGTGVTMLAVLGGRAGLGTLSIVAPYSGLWTLGYGYGANGTASDMNADLVGTGTPNNGFLIKMASAEYDYRLSLAVYTGGVASFAISDRAGNLNPHDVFVPFSSLSLVNFHDIDRISLMLSGKPDGDYAIDSISVVPEPASMALLAMGGLLALRRRRAH